MQNQGTLPNAGADTLNPSPRPSGHQTLTAGFCLDLTNGNKANGNRMQIWQCSTGNTNQVWTTAGASARRRGGRFDRA